MSNAYLSPILQDAQFNDDGTFLVGGLIWFYEAGTSTPLLAYTTPVADTAWTNPIQLNARGETGGEIWLKAGSSYKIILEGPPEYGQTHGVVMSTFDNISGVNDPGTTTIQNWTVFAGTPTYISSTSFSVSGDYRATFLESRRIRMANSDATIYYGTVVSSSYSSGITTIVVSPDYGQSVSTFIDSISYGFIETNGVSSIPIAINAGSSVSGSQYQMWIDYDGTNLKWAKDSDVASATWPINAETADAPSGSQFFVTAPSGGEADIGASCPTVNNAYLFNKADSWGVYSIDGGFGLKYDRGTSEFSFGGFTLPAFPANKYFGLPNGLLIQFGQVTTGPTGANALFPIVFPNAALYVFTSPVAGAATATSANGIAANGFTAFAATASTPVSYIAVGY